MDYRALSIFDAIYKSAKKKGPKLFMHDVLSLDISLNTVLQTNFQICRSFTPTFLKATTSIKKNNLDADSTCVKLF